MKFKELFIFFTFAVLIFIPSVISAQTEDVKAPKVDIASLNWFAGCWEANIPEREMIISEMWTKPTGGTLIGVGRTIIKGKTVSHEYLRIVEGAYEISYIAKPSSNSSETSFLLKNLGERNVVFENLENDFPQRIIYKSSKADTLSARIEATIDGKTKAVDFPMLRVKCS